MDDYDEQCCAFANHALILSLLMLRLKDYLRIANWVNAVFWEKKTSIFTLYFGSPKHRHPGDSSIPSWRGYVISYSWGQIDIPPCREFFTAKHFGWERYSEWKVIRHTAQYPCSLHIVLWWKAIPDKWCKNEKNPEKWRLWWNLLVTNGIFLWKYSLSCLKNAYIYAFRLMRVTYSIILKKWERQGKANLIEWVWIWIWQNLDLDPGAKVKEKPILTRHSVGFSFFGAQEPIWQNSLPLFWRSA